MAVHKDLKIGLNINKLRKKHGYTITWVAEQLGKTPQWLSNIENGRRSIGSSDLFKISQVLNAKVEDFFEDPYNKAFNKTGTDCK